MYGRILLSTDGSVLSRRAAAHAIALAASSGSELIVLNVVPRYQLGYYQGAATYESADIARIEMQGAASAQALVDGICEQARAKGVRARAALAKSDRVAEAILAAPRKHKAELIVMASHGRKGMRRLLLGSETQHVLALSTLPVLVLR